MSSATSKEAMDRLLTKRLIISDGIKSLEDIQRELNSDASLAQSWGNFATLLNGLMIPLNIILNASGAGQFNTLYKQMVRVLYTMYQAKSVLDGGTSKIMLEVFKKTVTEELKKKGTQQAAQFVPVVNIFMGMAEDSFEFLNIASEASKSSTENNRFKQKLTRDIEKAKEELLRIDAAIGISRGQVKP